MHEKVARLRQLMSEAVSQQPDTGGIELQTIRQFRLYDFNTAPAVLLDTSPRAKTERQIERIAAWYQWGAAEIVRHLDQCGASSLPGLADDDAHALLDRLQRLEECVREGLDCPDAPPAR